ncbi:hypothetical protein [Sulfuricurvum sp.]|uniref:hypothetical protein n=1 Tax=Sulfuricurvum sp. TaxID=2025608 RepID=UPI003BB4B8CC
MANLKTHEKVIFEKLFDRSGYVLDFTDATFQEFFKEHHIDINHQKYHINGTSKMKRLRAFWQIESDETVGNVLLGLLQYAEVKSQVDQDDKKIALEVINKLLGKQAFQEPKEDNFINLEFSQLNLSLLAIDPQFERVIQQRVDEIEKSLKSGSALAVIFLCGSTLEGLLQDKATKHPKEFNSAKSAPKNKDGKVLPIHEWTLNALIDVAYETSYIEDDIKKFSSALRDFRNYIHPRQQAISNFNPDNHTAKISWQVLQATIASLSGQRK